MFSNIKHGWATFQLGDFIGSASYLTDPVVELCETLLNYNGVVTIDEEGSTFDIVFSEGINIYVIEHRNTHILHTFDDLSISDFVKELISDIKNNFDAWLNWEPCVEYEEEGYLDERKAYILDLINKLEDKYHLNS